jgi:hypothetical protein
MCRGSDSASLHSTTVPPSADPWDIPWDDIMECVAGEGVSLAPKLPSPRGLLRMCRQRADVPCMPTTIYRFCAAEVDPFTLESLELDSILPAQEGHLQSLQLLGEPLRQPGALEGAVSSLNQHESGSSGAASAAPGPCPWQALLPHSDSVLKECSGSPSGHQQLASATEYVQGAWQGSGRPEAEPTCPQQGSGLTPTLQYAALLQRYWELKQALHQQCAPAAETPPAQSVAAATACSSEGSPRSPLEMQAPPSRQGVLSCAVGQQPQPQTQPSSAHGQCPKQPSQNSLLSYPNPADAFPVPKLGTTVMPEPLCRSLQGAAAVAATPSSPPSVKAAGSVHRSQPETAPAEQVRACAGWEGSLAHMDRWKCTAAGYQLSVMVPSVRCSRCRGQRSSGRRCSRTLSRFV